MVNDINIFFLPFNNPGKCIIISINFAISVRVKYSTETFKCTYFSCTDIWQYHDLKGISSLTEIENFDLWNIDVRVQDTGRIFIHHGLKGVYLQVTGHWQDVWGHAPVHLPYNPTPLNQGIEWKVDCVLHCTSKYGTFRQVKIPFIFILQYTAQADYLYTTGCPQAVNKKGRQQWGKHNCANRPKQNTQLRMPL